MNAHFAERHDDLMQSLFLALRECVTTGRINHHAVEPILNLAAANDAATVRRILEMALDKLKPDPVAAAIGARRAPTMSEVAEVLKCTPTQSR
jgi:hypothetical protein